MGWVQMGGVSPATSAPRAARRRCFPTPAPRCLSCSTRGRSTSLTGPLLSGMQALPEAGGREGRGGRAAAGGLCCGRLLLLTPLYSWGPQSCTVGLRSAGV